MNGALTGAASVPTITMSVGMPFCTGFAAIVLSIFLNGIFGGNDAQAWVTGAFHLGHSRHNQILNCVWLNHTTYEQIFIYFERQFIEPRQKHVVSYRLPQSR